MGEIDEMIDEALDDGDFEKLFMWVPSHEQLDYFLDWYQGMPPEDIIKHFRGVYSLTEYGFQRITPELLMDIYKDHKQTELTGEIIIYRGYTDKSTPLKRAYSWTTEKKVAEWFAKRFDNKGKIAKAKVKSENILDFINERNEYEVLVLPQFIEIIEKDII